MDLSLQHPDQVILSSALDLVRVVLVRDLIFTSLRNVLEWCKDWYTDHPGTTGKTCYYVVAAVDTSNICRTG